MDQRKHDRDTTHHHEPTIAPGMDLDDLEVDATEEEIRNNDYTSVTKLFIDRVE